MSGNGLRGIAATTLLGLTLLAAACQSSDAGPGSDGQTARLSFGISFPQERSSEPLDGRVLLFISNDSTSEPRFQSDQYRANSTQPIFGIDVNGLAPGQEAIVHGTVFGFPARSLGKIPAGEYWVQALLNRYETFNRADGHVVSMPPDKGEGQKWAAKPGNLYSTPVKMRVDPAADEVIHISLDQEIPPVPPPQDSKYVRHITMQSDLLTKFWGRPMFLGAIVLLPEGFDEHPDARYPLLIHHGHFPTTVDAWRETPPDAGAADRERTIQELSYQFYKDWTGPDFPRMIHVLIQHANPYFDDSYAVNSANVGPYGDAITYELIPYVESTFRGIGAGWARVLTGGSTGGWEALGVQVFYPDEYNGAWTFCPDPIDFRAYRSVDIYDSKNAYYYDDNPWKRTPKPGYRDYRGKIYSTFEERNHVELAIATNGRSGGQQDAWAAVFGPVGDDGYYKPLYDKLTGVIDPEVALYWRDNYDLRHILERDWPQLGPKLRGKIRIYIGDMDNGYLNNAVYLMEDFLKNTTNPPYDGVVVYGDRFEHCWTGDPDHPNWQASLTVHPRFMPEMARWMISTAPRGADTASWRY
ncbi:MAG TPA: alpha/beta hydrolase-fold protein [Longimicrobiales bacterium]|nr:alpha/beta hydrolase-fold protein [Longimicrobiales bacterium]